MNPYGTHILILKAYIEKFKPASVFEFGCGEHSTPLFIDKCERVVSVEMQKPEWFVKILEAYGSAKNFDLFCMPGQTASPEYLKAQNKTYDLVFVDGYMSRWIQINAAMQKTDVVITHDTDQPCYHWEKVLLPHGWTWVDIKDLTPWTSVITNKANVVEWAKEFNSKVYTNMEQKEYQGK